MASIIKPTAKEPAAEAAAPSSQDSMAADVQSYLISNYREALKNGDKSAAKSCLLAARYFSVNDPNVTNEIYIMAKSDGDVGEASKCFANIFNDLFVSPQNQNPLKASTSDVSAVVNQMKEETRILLGELKSHFLKLKSTPAPAALASRPVPSVNPSPMLSPRLRMSSEDRVASRESVTKLDCHLHSSTRSFFYQLLFDNLSEDTKRNILDHSIETCESPIERCRLMMLAISIFSDSVTTYGSRLLRTLIDLSGPTQKGSEASKQQQTFTSPHSSIMSRYAKSLLVFDAIPLVLNITSFSSLDIDIDDLFERTLNFYSDHCLEASAVEYEASELHEGLKKSIATRILGLGHNSTSEETTEEHVIGTLSLLSQKFIDILSDDDDVKAKLVELRSIVTDKTSNNKFDRLKEIIQNLALEENIPDDVLFGPLKEVANRLVVTPPSKGRGRPKKAPQQSVIVGLDDAVKKHLIEKSREVHFVFYSIVQHMFINCASYFRSTRSRVLIDFDNPLASHIETELSKESSSQRGSRSKSGNPLSNETSASPAKKPRLDPEVGKFHGVAATTVPIDESPLNSEQSRTIDRLILVNLMEAHKCLEFLGSSNCVGAFAKLWQRFLSSGSSNELDWYRRFSIESKLLSGHHESVVDLLESISATGEEVDKKKEEPESSGVTLMRGSFPVSVAELRRMIQLISCYVQRVDKIKTFDKIDELLSKIKQSGLLTNNDSYASGNIIDEYMTLVQHDNDHQNNLGFLFFDALSMIRYCADILMNILKRYSTSTSSATDAAIGHTIVLSQFDWPKESKAYGQCIDWLRVHKPTSTTPQCLSAATKFTYPEFFQYIRNPSMIEDFMAMLIQGYTLDIKGNNATNGYPAASNSQTRTGSSSQTSSSGSRGATSGSAATRGGGKMITTRGVNKTFKEDLKVAIVAQMRNSSALVPLDLITEFIQTSLTPYLSSR